MFVLIIFLALLVFGARFSSPKTLGKIGERIVANKLDWLSGEYIVLNDVLLPAKYGTSQVDHIVVSPFGIFVIETKNYKGWIFGHENSEQWTQSLVGHKSFFGWTSRKYKMGNPIRQNIAHVRAVRNLLKDLGDFHIIPIVVFSNKASLNITTPNHIVVNWRNLRSVIKTFRVPCISAESVNCIVKVLRSSNIISNDARKAHASNANYAKNKNEMMIANNRCPKCGCNLVERNGKFGKFLGCSNYPRCRFTHNFTKIKLSKVDKTSK